MKALRGITCLVALLTASAAHGDPMLPVIMSEKTISPSVRSITFTLKKSPKSTAARTRVFAMTGEEVAELDAKSLNQFAWDGKDVDQQDVPAGLYVVQIRHGTAVWHGPVIVIR